MNSKAILNHIEQVVKSPDDRNLIDTLADYSRSANPAACKEIIDQIKRVIKKNRWDPVAKLQALRLFDACLKRRNNGFVEYASRKILRRLTILATYKKVKTKQNETDLDRGKDMFKAVNPQHVSASIQFLSELLQGFEDWGKLNNDFLTSYRSLQSQGVKFPQVQVQVDNSSPETQAKSLKALMDMKNPDEETVDKLAKDLRSTMEDLSVQIQVSIHSPQLPDLITTHEVIQDALEAYEQFKENRMLIKPQVPDAEKAGNRSNELIMFAMLGAKAIPEPQPLDIPEAENDIDLYPSINSPLLKLEVTWKAESPQKFDDMVIPIQIENLKKTELMETIEGLKLENEALRLEVLALSKQVEAKKVAPMSLAHFQTLPPDRVTDEETTRVLRNPLHEESHMSVSISPNRPVDLLSFDSPMRATISISHFPTVPKEETLIIPEPQIVNDSWHLNSSLWTTGTVFRSPDLEVLAKVEIERQRGRLKLCFHNISPESILDLCLTNVSKEVQVRESIREPPPSPLLSDGQYVYELEARPQRSYSCPPVLNVSYHTSTKNTEFGLRLPLSVSRFVFPVEAPYTALESLLKELQGTVRKRSFPGLKSGIRNMKTLAEVFCLNNAFKLFFPPETGVQRALLGAGSGFGSAVLTQVQLNETASQVDLWVWSQDNTLRNQIGSLLETLIRKEDV